MNKFKKFALAMSMLLFDMRSEDLNTSIILTDANEQVPVDYVDKILNDVLHIDAMKEKLRMSVLQDVQDNPDKYIQLETEHGNTQTSEYVYSGDVYDHAYIIDEYIKNQYAWDNPVLKTVIVCDECGGINVQSRAWVRPNKDNEFVDLMSEEVQDNWCDDCDSNVSTSSIEVNVRDPKYVIN